MIIINVFTFFFTARFYVFIFKKLRLYFYNVFLFKMACTYY